MFFWTGLETSIYQNAQSAFMYSKHSNPVNFIVGIMILV